MLHLFRDKRRSQAIQVIVALGVVFTFLLGFNFLFGSGLSNPATSGNIGSIGGEPISAHDYQQQVSQQVEQYHQQSGRQLDEATALSMREYVWNNMVQQRVFARKAEQLGMGATDREIIYAARNLPPNEVAQIPAFQTNGRFDMGKYQRMLDNPKMPADFLLSLENQMRQTLPTMRLQLLASSMAKVTDPEAEAAIARTQQRVAATLLSYPTAANPVAPNQVTHADMEAYYDKHRAEFKREAETSLLIVSIPKTSSAEDEKSAAAQAQGYAREAATDTSFVQLAGQVSDQALGQTPTGKPGVLIERGRLLRELEAVVFSLQPGQVSPPVLSGNAYHIVKYIGPVTEQGVEKRHIQDLVVAIHPGEASLAKSRTQLEQIRDQAAKDGLENAASRARKEVFRTGFFAEATPPAGLNSLSDVIKFGFQAKKGEKSEILDKPGALLLVQVADRRGAGQRTLAEVEGEVRTKLAQEKSIDQSEAKARQFLAQAQAAGSLEAAAKAAGINLVTENFTRSGPFLNPVLKGEPRVVGAAFGLPVGQPRVIRGDQGAYLVRVTDRPAMDAARMAGQLAVTKTQLMTQKRQEYVQTWAQEIQEEAKVKDFRAQIKTGSSGS